MVATGVAVDARRAAELAHPDDGRVFQQSAFGQVGHQGAGGFVELRQLVVFERGEVAVVGVPTAQIDFHERHALFHQPARHQAAAAKVGAAVLLLHGGVFLADLEGVHLLAGHQADGLLENLGVILGRLSSALLDEIFFQRGQHGHALIEPIGVGAQLEVADVAVGVDDKRRVAHAQKARADAAAADGHEGRNLEFEFLRLLFQHAAHDAAVAGMLDVGVGHVAGVHVVAAAIVIGFARAHRADDRQVMHLLGQ